MLLAALVDMTMRERAELQQAAHRMAQRRMTDLGLGGSPVFHSLQARMQLLQVARLRILGSQGALLRCAVLSLHGLAHRHVVVPCSALGSRQSISAPAACSHGMPGPELVQAGCIGASTLGAVGKCEAGTVGKWRMPHQSMVHRAITMRICPMLRCMAAIWALAASRSVCICERLASRVDTSRT